MNQEITPWSIYDKQFKVELPRRLAKRVSNRKQSKSSMTASEVQSTYNYKSIKTKLLNVCQDEKEQTEMSLNYLVMVRLIHQNLKTNDTVNFSLPQITKPIFSIKNALSGYVPLYKLILTPPFRPRIYNEQYRKSQLKSQISTIAVCNLNPFDQTQLLKRGISIILQRRQKSIKGKKLSNKSTSNY